MRLLFIIISRVVDKYNKALACGILQETRHRGKLQTRRSSSSCWPAAMEEIQLKEVLLVPVPFQCHGQDDYTSRSPLQSHFLRWNLIPYGILRESFGIFRESLEAVQNHLVSLGILWNLLASLGFLWNPMEPITLIKISNRIPSYEETYQNHESQLESESNEYRMKTE